MSRAGGGGVAQPCPDVVGLVLAGGLGRRMGGRQKAFVPLAGRPLVAHVLDRLRPQVAHVAISANAQREQLAVLGGVEAVLADPVAGHAGPLAGVLAGLFWLRAAHPQVPWLLTVAVDTPFFPHDLAVRLRAAVERDGAELAVACSAGRVHPVFGLWPVAVAEELWQALREEGLRKAEAFMMRHALTKVCFGTGQGDPFFNINTPEDLQMAEEMVMRG